jgi:hypothetical protein
MKQTTINKLDFIFIIIIKNKIKVCFTTFQKRQSTINKTKNHLHFKASLLFSC